MSDRIVILGGGESGAGAAVLAQKQGFDVFVSDFGEIKPKYQDQLNQAQIAWEHKQHTEDKVLSAKEIVKSPGIPETAPIIVKAKEAGIPIISEIEFAGRYSKARHICITGSNGKTTTTSLLYYMMKNAGLKVGLAGNIGKSFALQVAENEYDYYVIELSSFQLDGIYDFKADIAILLNITPDHLDRYEYDIKKYAASKFRITQNLNDEECFIFCSDDEITITALEEIVVKARKLPFSIKVKENQAAYIEDEHLKINLMNDEFMIPIKDLSLKGKHNTYNSMAAGIAANVLKLRKEIIRDSLMSFQGVEHRLEFVLKVHGIDFINDSKATNINSTWYALESMVTPTIWIVGGVDKGNNYEELSDLVSKKVKAIVCLGKDNEKIKAAFNDQVETIVETQSMEEAVRSAYYLAKKEETVLLSPACASFDLFDNYEDRGYKFKKSVKGL